MNKRSIPSTSRRAFCVSLACLAFATLTNFSAAAPVPAPLDAVGESAEGIFDGVRANKWSKVSASIKEVGAKLQEFPAAKVAPADFTAALATLEQAAKAKDRLATMVASNELTRLAAEAARNFEPPHPVEVTLLDYLGRELVIYTEKNDEAKIKSVVATIRATWDKVRAAVEAKNSKTAGAFNTLVGEIEQNKELKTLSPLTRKLLDQVDDLEGVFK